MKRKQNQNPQIIWKVKCPKKKIRKMILMLKFQ